jgi:hypothetical protein
LVRPRHWKVHQALDTKAARQSTVDRRFDEGGAKESERDRSADPTFGFAFARGERFDGLVGTPGQFVEPAMSVAKRVSEDRTRFGSHQARDAWSFALALDDLAAPMGRRRRPGNDQDAILIVTRHPLGKLDLDRRSRCDDALDGGAAGFPIV